jgi:glycosyltransferase involved in cell wall biosynthesis
MHHRAALRFALRIRYLPSTIEKFMRLAVDAHRLSGQRTGIGRYLEALVTRWAQMDHSFERVTLYSWSPLAGVPHTERMRNVVVRPKISGLFWENFRMPITARQDDVLFCPSYSMPLAFRGPCVVTMHGGFDRAVVNSYPLYYSLRFLPFYRFAAMNAAAILMPCQSAKERMLNYYNHRPDARKVVIVPPGAEEAFRPVDDKHALRRVREKFGIGDSPLILFVGKLSVRRNISTLLEAFAALKRKGLPHKLMLAGPNYLKFPLGERARQLNVESHMIHSEFVEHDDLIFLYNAADVFVLPSEGEGFSFTVLEAMACGTPVITLNRPSLDEQATGAALLLDECTVESLSSAIVQVVSDASLRADLRAKGLARAQHYSWDNAARDTMRVLEAVARGEPVKESSGLAPGSQVSSD